MHVWIIFAPNTRALPERGWGEDNLCRGGGRGFNRVSQNWVQFWKMKRTKLNYSYADHLFINLRDLESA